MRKLRYYRQMLAIMLAFVSVLFCVPPVFGASGGSLYQKKYSIAPSNDSTDSKVRSVARWSSPVTSYMFENADGTLGVLRSGCGEKKNQIRIDTYDRDYTLFNTTMLLYEAPLFGGFYRGDKAQYLAFGAVRENLYTPPFILLVKYDLNFQRIGAVKATNLFFDVPFDAGTCRMAESGDEVIMHLARLRNDGHQSQLTIYFDMNTLTINETKMTQMDLSINDDVLESDSQKYQINHVSHSFNQFVQYDGDDPVLIDLGDGSPRSVVLHKIKKGQRYDWDTDSQEETLIADELDLFRIPGTFGANQTGVSVGGFEISSKNYLVAITSVDHSAISSYDSYNLYDLNGNIISPEEQERNLLLLVSQKDNNVSENVRQVRLTDYFGSGFSAGIPKLVKLSEDRFLVLWEEYNGLKFQRVNYVLMDGDGNQVGKIETIPGARLSDCQPIVYDEYITWFTEERPLGSETSTRTLYWYDISPELRTISPTEYAIQSLSYQNQIGKAKISSMSDEAYAVFVLSNCDGKQIECKFLPVKAGIWSYSFTFGHSDDAIIKALIIDKGFLPLSAVAEIKC